jgi:hypothetical protein
MGGELETSQPTPVSPQAGLVYRADTQTYENQRTPSKFVTIALSASGNTLCWTPAAGKRFRILGGFLTVGDAVLAAAGPITVSISDAGVTTNITWRIYLGTSPMVNPLPPLNLGPNGYLSTGVGNSAGALLSAALSSGSMQLTLWGTEE